jgi:hypothetical protein
MRKTASNKGGVLVRLLAGRHIHKQKKVVSGGTFRADSRELEYLKHRIELLEEVPVEDEEARKRPVLEKDHRGGGRYLVVNTETGTPVSDDLMTSAEADIFIEENSGGDTDTSEVRS